MHMPNNVELEDLESYGAFGLLDAVDKFDPERDVKFETYATTRTASNNRWAQVRRLGTPEH